MSAATATYNPSDAWAPRAMKVSDNAPTDRFTAFCNACKARTINRTLVMELYQASFLNRPMPGYGMPVLWFALTLDNRWLSDFLLTKDGHDLTFKNVAGQNLLMWAAKQGLWYNQTSKILLKWRKHFDLEAKDNKGFTALAHTLTANQDIPAKILKIHGANAHWVLENMESFYENDPTFWPKAKCTDVLEGIDELDDDLDQLFMMGITH